MHTQKLPNLDRQRRRQVIILTIGIGLFTAALAGAAVYYLYQTSHLRMLFSVTSFGAVDARWTGQHRYLSFRTTRIFI